MAFSREILGVHFPSDSESGRVLARQVVDRMLQVPRFRQDLEEARREIRAADKTGKQAANGPAEKKTSTDCF